MISNKQRFKKLEKSMAALNEAVHELSMHRGNHSSGGSGSESRREKHRHDRGKTSSINNADHGHPRFQHRKRDESSRGGKKRYGGDGGKAQYQGRAGKTGVASTFLTMHDTDVFYDLKQMLIQSNSPVPPELARHEASKFKPGSIPDRPPRRNDTVFTH